MSMQTAMPSFLLISTNEVSISFQITDAISKTGHVLLLYGTESMQSLLIICRHQVMYVIASILHG